MKMINEIKVMIRVNTDHFKDIALPPWRVICVIDGESREQKVDHVDILCPCETTMDEVEPGVFKLHITARPRVGVSLNSSSNGNLTATIQ